MCRAGGVSLDPSLWPARLAPQPLYFSPFTSSFIFLFHHSMTSNLLVRKTSGSFYKSLTSSQSTNLRSNFLRPRFQRTMSPSIESNEMQPQVQLQQPMPAHLSNSSKEIISEQPVRHASFHCILQLLFHLLTYHFCHFFRPPRSIAWKRNVKL
jgi:hypothetical protein